MITSAPHRRLVFRIRNALALSAALLALVSAAPAHAGGANPSVQPQDKSLTAPSSHKEGHAEHGRGNRHGRGHFLIKESASLFEMESRELADALNSGKSLADVAREKKGWTQDQYVQKLTEAAGQRIDKAVAEGRFTSEQAAKLKAGLPAMLKARVSEKGPFRDPHKQGKAGTPKA